MATMRTVHDGLEILLKYSSEGVFAEQSVIAEHDVIYAGSTSPEEMTAEHRRLLALLGWRWDSELECWSIST